MVLCIVTRQEFAESVCCRILGRTSAWRRSGLRRPRQNYDRCQIPRLYRITFELLSALGIALIVFLPQPSGLGVYASLWQLHSPLAWYRTLDARANHSVNRARPLDCLQRPAVQGGDL